MKYISVRNFERFQHYRDRRPPWIKLYQEVLEDYEFTRLQDASRSHLLAIWLLASRYENRIPCDPQWIARAIMASSPVNLDVLVKAGFITLSGDDSAPLAERQQVAMPEGEGEKEIETEKRPTFSLAPYLDVYKARFDATPPGGRFGKVLKGVERKNGAEETLRRWKIFVPVKGELGPEYFARTWSEWAQAPSPNGHKAKAVNAEEALAAKEWRTKRVQWRKEQDEPWWARMEREAEARGEKVWLYAAQHLEDPA